MTAPERRAALAKNERLNLYWKIILGVEIASALLVVVGGMLGGAAAMIFGGILGAIVWVAVLLIVGVVALITWGVYNIERWVVVLMWISFIGNLLGALGKFNTSNVFQLAFSAFALFSYRSILKFVSPQAPTATPPATPTAK